MYNKLFNLTVFTLVLMNNFITEVRAQPIEVIADYPLILNLTDSTGNFNDVFVEGNPVSPTLPTAGSPLCSNGIYVIEPNGQNIQTPIMSRLDITNFEIEVEFNVTLLPSASAARPRMPIIMGSKFARWLGIYIDSNGNMGFKHNNDVNNYVWSSTAISGIGVWNSSRITYSKGDVDLYLNNQLILSQNVGPLNTFQNTFNFTVTDFSEGNPFHGCIRNLVISTSPINIFKSGFE
jgi:hypothetical protein